MSFVFFAAGAAANRATMPAQPETAPVPSMEERLATAIQADEATANDLNEELAKVAQGYCGEIYGRPAGFYAVVLHHLGPVAVVMRAGQLHRNVHHGEPRLANQAAYGQRVHCPCAR